MDLVLYVEQQNIEKLKQLLFGDDLVSRANIIVHEASSFGKEGGFFLRILGEKAHCKKALELSKDLATKVTGDEKKSVLNKIKEESERSLEGFGGIFG
jgi:hypothetical protein